MTTSKKDAALAATRVSSLGKPEGGEAGEKPSGKPSGTSGSYALPKVVRAMQICSEPPPGMKEPPPSKPASVEELDESLKRLQRAITGSDDTGEFTAVVDVDAALDEEDA